MSIAGNSIAAPARMRAARIDWTAWAHHLLLTAFLMFSFIGPEPMFLPTPEERVAGNSLDRIAVPSMTLLALALIWARREAALECLRANKLLVSVILFCQASLMWSDYPGLTLRRALLLLFLSLIGLGLAASIDDLRQFHARLFRAMVFVILVNLAATAIWPELAITDIGVAGIYYQKNPAGMVAMIAVIVCVTYAFGGKSVAERIAGFFGAALALFFLLITQSKTSIGLTFLGLGVGLLFLVAQKLGARFALLSFGGMIAAMAGFIGLAMDSDFDGEKILGAFVHDTTFTGRSELWAFAWRSVLQRPWFGHGYGAFWDVGAANDPLAKLEPGTWLGDVDVGVINQAHDGYLELCLHIGLPMTALAVLAIFAALARATGKAVSLRASSGVHAAYGMIALLLLLHLLHNLTEATLMMRGASFCNLVLLLCLVVARTKFSGRTG